MEQTTRIPRISIVTPSFNQGMFLDETIRSVLEQGYDNLEYIIMDGKSTDESAEIIRRYQDRLAFWTSAEDNGQYDAINKGFTRSTGDIMAWINSDDRYLPHAFSVVAEIFSSFPEVEWITSLHPVALNQTGQSFYVGSSPGFHRQPFYQGVNLPQNNPRLYPVIQQESTFWRRSLWERVGGRIDTSLAYAADFELWARFFEHADLYGIYALIGGFRVHNDQKTNTHSDDYLNEARSVLSRYPRNPYSSLSGYIRNTILRLNPIFKSCRPSFFLSAAGLAHPVKNCRWNGRRWEIEQCLIV